MADKYKKIISILLAMAVFCTFFTSCGKKEGETATETEQPAESTEETPEASATPMVADEDGVLKLSVCNVDTLNPLNTQNEDVRIYMETVCDTIVGLDSIGNPLPRICESWSSADTFKTWKITVGKNVKTHEGTVVNAEAVKKVLDFVMEYGGNYAANLENVAEITTEDENTVKITLNEADSLFMCKLKIPFVTEAGLTTDKIKTVSGAGMYKIKSYEGSEILLEAFEDFYDSTRKPEIKNVNIRVYSTEYQKYSSDADVLIYYGDETAADTIDGNVKSIPFTGNEYSYVAINCNSTYLSAPGDGDTGTDIDESKFTSLPNIFANKDARKALNLLVSREQLLNAAASGNGTISLMPAKSGLVYRCKTVNDIETDEEEAEALLQKAGLKKVETVIEEETTEEPAEGATAAPTATPNTQVEWYNSDGSELIVQAIAPKNDFAMRTIMRYVAEALRNVGVNVVLYELSDSEFQKRLENKQYMLAPVQVSLGSWVDMADIFASGGELNYSHYSNEKIDKYFDTLGSLDGNSVVLAAYNEIEKILLEDNPIVGLFISNYTVTASTRLMGVQRENFYSEDPLAMIYTWQIGKTQ